MARKPPKRCLVDVANEEAQSGRRAMVGWKTQRDLAEKCRCAFCRLMLRQIRAIDRDQRERDRATARAVAKTRCPGCGCTRANPCVLVGRGYVSIGLCVSAGSLPGHTTCSGCLSPELRGNGRAEQAWREFTPIEVLEREAVDLWTPERGVADAIEWLASLESETSTDATAAVVRPARASSSPTEPRRRGGTGVRTASVESEPAESFAPRGAP